MHSLMRIVAVTALGGAITDVQAQEENVFSLGKITVAAPRLQSDIGDDVVTTDEVWSFNRNTLDEAVKLIPGVTSTFDSTGRRNERDILVRGFGRLQVPLSIDGIRVYLPADNRLDFSRFLTQDLAQIQVQKGYASVLEGPGGMGGAINLVTRKPTKEFEMQVQSGASFDNDESSDGWNGYAMVGTRQDRYYLQASGSYLDRDHWRLSDDFRPTAIENGGDRDSSDNRDWRVNVKAGWTPNATDEYSLSYTAQSGAKGAPLHVGNNPPNPPNSYWRWPWWDIKNLYWLSTTQLGELGYVKTRLFHNKFENALYAYDNATYTTQSANGRFRSIYDDTGYGGSVEFGLLSIPRNELKAAMHYRHDEHMERNLNRPTSPAFSSVEPWQTTEEVTWSLALENTFKASEAIDLVAGFGYDNNQLKQAQEFNATAGLFGYPIGDSHATSVQALARWRYTDGAALHASISSRTRFPTIFERYSTRFGTAVPNPQLDPERAINYEIGWDGRFGDKTSLTAAVFYSDVQDVIQTIVVAAGPPQLTQTSNVGDGEFYGVELGFDSQVTGRLRLGANYSYLKRAINDPLQPNLKATGTPTHTGFVYASYRPIELLAIMPSIEFADARWSDVTGGGYRQVGKYTLINLQIQYQPLAGIEFAAGARNLRDANFQLADGYPEAGRTFFTKLDISF